MCRIASLFSLQRVKGSMSGDARDFNNIETRVVITLFFALQGRVPKLIHAILKETLGEPAPSYATVKNWVARFKRGDFFFPPVMRLVLDDPKQWPLRHTCPSAWSNSAPTGPILMKFFWIFSEKPVDRSQFSVKSDKNYWYFIWKFVYICGNTPPNSF